MPWGQKLRSTRRRDIPTSALFILLKRERLSRFERVAHQNCEWVHSFAWSFCGRRIKLKATFVENRKYFYGCGSATSHSLTSLYGRLNQILPPWNPIWKCLVYPSNIHSSADFISQPVTPGQFRWFGRVVTFDCLAMMTMYRLSRCSHYCLRVFPRSSSLSHSASSHFPLHSANNPLALQSD